jgi:hypothetical protein
MSIQVELDERFPGESAINRWLAAARNTESCVGDIDCDPPTKSSAERRAVSPKVRLDVAGGGSLISPQPVAFLRGSIFLAVLAVPPFPVMIYWLLRVRFSKAYRVQPSTTPTLVTS